ncbi:hypothetical protein, partial [Staphylococcus gallinarum]
YEHVKLAVTRAAQSLKANQLI